MLVVANETVLGAPLLDRIRHRARRAPRVPDLCPQSDPVETAHPEAERRCARRVNELRGSGVEAHGQIAHPDPYSAAMQAVTDERVDEMIVSTFPGERSGWLRRDLVGRLRAERSARGARVVDPPRRRRGMSSAGE